MQPTIHQRNSASFLILLFAAGLLIGGFVTFYVSYVEVNRLRDDIAVLDSRLSSFNGNQNTTYQNVTVFQDSAALASIYSNVRESVVLIQGTLSDGTVIQGSGFIYDYANRMVVVTNNHVVADTTGLSVAFSNGHGYAATVLCTDAYADLAVVSVNDAAASEFKPVDIVSSASLSVGDQVIAIGNPYGLVGSATTGIVSAVGRTLTEDTAGGFAIANVIQTSAPINPGNSGGPLLNVLGNVVGITTAIITDSQGLGLAVPSNTILREISALISTGTYRGHSLMGISGGDMSYETAQQIKSNVTYGVQLATILSGGPSDGKLKVNDIIIALNGTLIRNNDDLASFLEEKTLPLENLVVTVMRNNERLDVTIVLGTRPAPTT